MVDILDQVIITIRESSNNANAKELIIDKYDFSELQAEAIVTLQLYRLSNTDIFDLNKEKKNLNTEQNKLKKILSSEEQLKHVIINDLASIKDRLSVERKSSIENEIAEIKISEHELIPNEDVIISLSKDGYIKRSSLRSYNASGEESCGLKHNDAINAIYEATTLETLLLFTNKGNYIYLPTYKINELKWKDIGSHISNLVLIDNDEFIINSFLVKNFNLDIDVLIGTQNGMIKKTKLYEFEVLRYNKKLRSIKLRKDDQVVSVDFGTPKQDIVVVTVHGCAIKYQSNEIGLLGTSALGVTSINFKNKQLDKVAFTMLADNNDDMLLLTSRGNVIRYAVTKLELLTRNRKPQQLTSYVRSSPHDIIAAVKLMKQEYKSNIPVTLLANIKNKVIDAYSIKYPTSNNGKNYLNSSYGEVKSIVKIKRIFDFDIPLYQREEKEEEKEDVNQSNDNQKMSKKVANKPSMIETEVEIINVPDVIKTELESSNADETVQKDITIKQDDLTSKKKKPIKNKKSQTKEESPSDLFEDDDTNLDLDNLFESTNDSLIDNIELEDKSVDKKKEVVKQEKLF